MCISNEILVLLLMCNIIIININVCNVCIILIVLLILLIIIIINGNIIIINDIINDNV